MPSEHKYFMRVEYEGTRYSGWQRQPETATIQEHLENALAVVLRQKIPVVGAGRTDAGVHARKQGAHFLVPDPIDCGSLEKSLNGILPGDIAVSRLQPVSTDFHARYSALSRTYTYTLLRHKHPIERRYAWLIQGPCDYHKMASIANAVCGTHDFSAFCAAGADTQHNNCEVRQSVLTFTSKAIFYTIEANRFVYKMVRSLVGTMVDIGRARLRDESLAAILQSRDRSRAGVTAPAHGLTLDTVSYGEHL